MWQGRSAGEACLFVVIGPHRVESGVLSGGRWLVDSFREAPFDAVSGAAARGALDDALNRLTGEVCQWNEAQAPGARRLTAVHVLVSDLWLSSASVPWSPSLHRGPEALAFCRGQFAAAGQELHADDLICLDDAPYGEPRLALAYPDVLLTALQRLASRAGATLESVRSLSVAAWRWGHSGKLRALAVLDDGLVFVTYGERHLADAVARRVTPPGSVFQSLGTHWQRMRLRDPQLAGIEALQVLSLAPTVDEQEITDAGLVAAQGFRPERGDDAAPVRLQFAAWQAGWGGAALDAIRERPAVTSLRRGVAALCTLLMLTVVWQGAQNFRQVSALSRQMADLAAPPAATSRPVSLSREEAARLEAVNAAVAELNFPVHALLNALSPPKDIHVAVLRLELKKGFATIVADAQDGTDMARYASFLGTRQPFSSAYLSRHDVVETGPERLYRFTVEAAWVP